MDLLKAILEMDLQKVLIFALVLIALALAGVNIKGRGGRRLLSIGSASGYDAGTDLSQSLVKAIDERVVHKWDNVVSKDFQELGKGIDALRAEVRGMDERAQRRIDRLNQEVEELDRQREENALTVTRFEGRLENVEGTCGRLEEGQRDTHNKLDILLERRKSPRG